MSDKTADNIKKGIYKFFTFIYDFIKSIGDILKGIWDCIISIYEWIQDNTEVFITGVIFILIILFLLWLSWLLNKFALSNFGWVVFIICCLCLVWFSIWFVYGSFSPIGWCANMVFPFLIWIFYTSLQNAADIKMKKAIYG